MPIESVMPSNHLVLCRPFLLLTSVFPSIRVFSNESALHIRWPKYWNFSISTSPSNEYSQLISFRIDWFELLAVQGTLSSLLQHGNWKSPIFVIPPNKILKPAISHLQMHRYKVIHGIEVCNIKYMKQSKCPTKVCIAKAMLFPIVTYGWESWSIRKLNAKDLMLFNCGVGKDSWESFELQGDLTSQS